MKKFLTVLSLALLMTITANAHHLVANGWCSSGGGKAAFSTALFDNNLNVEVQYKPFNKSGINDPWLTGISFNTPASGSTLTLFSLPQPIQNQTILVRFRYKNANSTIWVNWSTPQNSATNTYSVCGSLPIRFISLNIQPLTTDTYRITFEVGSVEDITDYDIKVSSDGINFKSVKIFAADPLVPNRIYTQIVTIKN